MFWASVWGKYKALSQSKCLAGSTSGFLWFLQKGGEEWWNFNSVGQGPALIYTVFHVGDCLWAQQNGAQKIKKVFFQDRFYSLKAHANYFTTLIYLATWRAAKLGIFTHFTSINLPQCSQSINSQMYVYYIDPQLLFMNAWSQ